MPEEKHLQRSCPLEHSSHRESVLYGRRGACLVGCARAIAGQSEAGGDLSVHPKRLGANDRGQAQVDVCGSRGPEPRPWWRSRRAEEEGVATLCPGCVGRTGLKSGQAKEEENGKGGV